MTAVLTGKIARLVRIDNAGGAIYEFWVEMPGGGGAVRATEAIAGQFREGDVVVVEGNRSPEGVLDAARISRFIPRKPPTRPFWLLPPYRLLLFAVPMTAFVAYAIVWYYTVEVAVDRRPSDHNFLFSVLGVGLFMYARARIRNLQLRVIAKTAAITFVATAAASYLGLTRLQEKVVPLILLAAVAGGVLVATLVRIDRKQASRTPPPSPQAGH